MTMTSATKARTPRNPLVAIMSPDQRMRRDAKAALRYVVQKLEGDNLRSFLQELSVLLAKWHATVSTSEPPSAR